MKEPISITAISSVSALGNTLEEVWQSYTEPAHLFSSIQLEKEEVWGAQLNTSSKEAIEKVRNDDPRYGQLDQTVLFALSVSRNAIRMAGWNKEADFGINIGSSRGATGLMEKNHSKFLAHGSTTTLSSPTTTLGNISSWVAHDLGTQGPTISHSITCSTALHSMLNGVAWIQSGLTDKFLVGGSEAPLTPFTIAQMKALKIYAYPPQKQQTEFPCRALDLDKTRNTMILGEAASVACLESGKPHNALACIMGIGYATEVLEHNVSISADAICFQKSMKMALGSIAPSKVDVVVMHAPGTIKGDSSEYNAIKQLFGATIPCVTTNKWKVGHSFGASGALSVEMAVLMLQEQYCIYPPYVLSKKQPKKIELIVVNAVGFGGNAVSILLGLPTRV